MKIFGLSGDPRGQKQSGKDTFAMFFAVAISKEKPGFKVRMRAFADPLKKFCMEYVGLSHDACYGEDADKDGIFGVWGEVFDSKLQSKYEAGPGDEISGRTIMQVVGTDIFRESFRDTFWIDMMQNVTIPNAREDNIDLLFITDMRFRNEIDMVQQNGGETFRIYRDIKRANSIVHRSEQELAEIPDEEFDHIIHNEGDLDSFRGIVRGFLYQKGLL